MNLAGMFSEVKELFTTNLAKWHMSQYILLIFLGYDRSKSNIGIVIMITS